MHSSSKLEPLVKMISLYPLFASYWVIYNENIRTLPKEGAYEYSTSYI